MAKEVIALGSWTVVGAYGLPFMADSRCEVLFTDRDFRVNDCRGHVLLSTPVAELVDLEIDGAGPVTTHAGFIGGGVGLEGAVEGMVLATILNGLTARTTKINTVLRITHPESELTLHTSDMTPDSLKLKLAPVLAKLRANARARAVDAGARSNGLATQLAALTDLHARGALTLEEFVVAKSKVLGEF